MLSKDYRSDRPFFQAPTSIQPWRQVSCRTLSPATIITSSSGYSTGGSSISTALGNSSNFQHQHEQQQLPKRKTKGFHHLINKLKNLIIPSKSKLNQSNTMHSTFSRDDQSFISYNHPPLSMETSQTISLPFTYFQTSSIPSEERKTKTFDQIAAWLNHHDESPDLKYIDENRSSLSSQNIDDPVLPSMMMIHRTPSTNNRTPKRSTSLVSTLTRPIFERRSYDRSVSPASSFSSSILVRGMSEAMTPQKISYQSRPIVSQEKSNRRRIIDFNRRRTVAGPMEPTSHNKENLPFSSRPPSYRYSPAVSNEHQTKKYFFHPTSTKRSEDNPSNSYGSTHLRHSVSSVYLISHVPVLPPPLPPPQSSLPPSVATRTPSRSVRRRSSLHFTPSYPTSPESLDDLLCDREVESYFYPSHPHPEPIYINIPTPPNHYQPLPYLQGTLC